MVASLYTRLEATARRLIQQYGKPAALARDVRTGQDYNPTVTTQTIAIQIVEIDYSLTNRDASLVQVGDKLGLISTAASSAPLLSDRIVIDGITYSLVDLQPLNPGGLVLLYEFHARR